MLELKTKDSRINSGISTMKDLYDRCVKCVQLYELNKLDDTTAKKIYESCSLFYNESVNELSTVKDASSALRVAIGEARVGLNKLSQVVYRN